MASSPVKFLFAFLFVSAVGWIFFTFASRLLAWFLSRVLGASVGFRVAGCNCLRDVSLKFNKGAIHSVCVGEIKLSLRKSLVKLGFSFISREPKLQLLISDLEVIVRSPAQSAKRSKSQRPRGTGRAKWMVLTNVARLLSISVNELIFKAPKAAFEVKDLKLDMSKSGGSTPLLNIKLYLIPLLVQIWDSKTSLDQFSFDQWECSASAENNCAPFICEDMSVTSELCHDKEHGIQIKNLDMRCGDITVNLSESLFIKTKLRSDAFAETVPSGGPANDLASAKLSQNDKLSSMLKKQIFLFPDKVNFRLPKLNLRFVHRSQGLFSQSNVMGIHLRSSKSQVFEDSGDMTSHLDIQTDMTEIHILKEEDSSTLEILKVVLTASVDVPMQLSQPIRSEIDIKLGGTQCNLIVNRLKPWLSLDLSKKKERVVHAEQEKCQTNKNAAIMWTFTVSAPEMTVVLYSLNDVPLYYGCSQSSHLFANNIASKGVQVHAELGEVHFYMADEYHKCLKLDLFDAEANFGSLLHMARVGLDWGLREMETHEEQDSNRLKLVFAIDITGMGLYFGFSHIESLLLTFFAFKTFLKSLPISRKRGLHDKAGHSRKSAANGTRILKLNLEKCNIKYCGEVSMDDMVIADPKRVNFGSQGGVVMINVSADGTTRRASIISNTTSGCKKLKFYTSLSISHVSVCLNKERRSLQIDLERARSIYQESSHDHTHGSSKVTIFDVQHAKFVRRAGGLSEVDVCSLLNVTDISIRWEPDVHLAIFEFMTAVKCFLHKIKNPSSYDGVKGELHSLKEKIAEKEIVTAQAKSYKSPGKREAVFAIDVEKLKLTAEIADGVETVIHVQSIFSENARIGVLLEELMLSFNNANVFKSSRMQISRIPVSTTGNSSDAKVQLTTSWDTSTWDWVIQGPDLHICMPYRLQLRAIEDAVEDMLRGLKLITDAKASLMLHVKKDNSRKLKSKPANFGTVRFIIRKLTADIEEEPIQGWLDEHYQLMKTEICEAAVRAKFLDDILDTGSNSRASEPKELCSERKLFHNGVEIDASNNLSIKDLYEDIQKQAFRSYYRACKKLVPSEGSGACTKGFQSGFKTSKNRASLLSLRAMELDVTLTKVVEGDAAMVEFIKKMDPVSLDDDIPFSRTYGRDVDLTSGSLVLQLRNYTFPLFSATAGKCKGRVVLAQQATSFQPQIEQDVYIGKWWKVRMLRSASGTTPPMKIYSDLPIYFNKVEVSFGVGYEPSFADISYAFTVALRRANLGSKSWASTTKDQDVSISNPPKKERSLPWWDDMRYYIHGRICLFFMETSWNLLATTNPYEMLDKLKIVSAYMEIRQSDGRLLFLSKDFKIYLSSLESLVKNCSLKLPSVSVPFLRSPGFSLEVTMDWDCESGSPLNHYLHASPKEGEPRNKVFDPFRSTSLSLRWIFSLRPSLQCYDEHTSSFVVANGPDESMHDSSQMTKNIAANSPTMNLGAHDLAWLFKWWSLNYSPPHKLRSFSRWPRFGVTRAARSGNLSLDKVMIEFFLRLDATPSCIRYMPLSEDDPASGLTFETTRLKYELCYSRGKQLYTFHCKRELLDLVYQGLDLHLLKAFLCTNNKQDVQSTKGASPTLSTDSFCNEYFTYPSGSGGKNGDDGFLLYSDYFTIRRQAPKADPARLLAWQEAGRRNLEMTYVRSEFENGSESDHTRSDPSDDDGFNVVIADNCRRVFVYGLKLLWTIENRDAVWSWVGGISKAFEPIKPSPSRQYAQRKLLEEHQRNEGPGLPNEDNLRTLAIHSSNSPSSQHVETLSSVSPVSVPTKVDCTTSNAVVNHGRIGDSEDNGARHFMVNVIQPQFNLHSEEANGRFLLAAASGRVLARSFHSILHVGYEMIEQALGTSSASFPDMEPEMTWKRAELSVMLEHVQAHVAPTDVDPGAGLQWLPKILRSSPKIKRTGALLERVFMPCQMYFRYTRHKGGTAELKVKPLKELIFNSPNITATMTSRQFQVMLDVLSNLLFARLPKPRKSSLSYPNDDDDDVEEEADEVVPDGVEEVELARIQLEKKERERKLFLDDIRTLSVSNDIGGDLNLFTDRDSDLWMVSCGKLRLIRGLRKELGNAQKSRKEASSALRMALQKAAQLRLMEKEKNKSPSCAMRISMRINKVVWSMLADGKSFAEAEINDMIYDFDRDYKDIGVAQFTTKSFVVRNCLPNAKSDMLLSAWNAPPEWGKNVMLRVNAKQGAPKDGSSPLELFQVEIYPLKIHLTETMYRMMWGYFFPEEDQDSQRRQEVWKVSTTAGSRRVRKSASVHEANPSSSYSAREIENTGRPVMAASQVIACASVHADSSQVSKLQSLRANIVCGANPEFRRTPSHDRTDETLAEPVTNEPALPVHSLCISSKSGAPNPALESQQGVAEDTFRSSKPKDPKPIKSGRLSNEEKKVGKPHDEKRARSRRMMEFHNIKISQVELLVTYEGSRFAVNDLRLLMDTFHRDEFIGTWRRLFSRVKKHIIWGVLKSVTGMQGKKFKDKAQSQREGHVGVVPESDLNFSDSDGGQPGKFDQFPVSWLKRPSDGAGDGFVTSIRGLFNSQRRKAKAFVLRTMRGEAENEFNGEWSESDTEYPFARQLTITKAKKLIRRHTRKFRSRAQKNSGAALQIRESHPSTPRETTPFQSDSSGGSSYEDFND